ncbi:type III-B CRISPR module RAMP protein Cmr4 [Thermogemmata fonticola]|uniref:Type III-B CRISPR module RAMP protein Cmr4 n=1 Tax=Thermogemmata fonticola TaxID=2755323 RepID=A0A7V9ABW9_9BACT|nr:type III-B CRISPR module RAMP protein Cmr4 [Thermogemmata fonticola]MBA2226671.1 type III-B CRISPR module RAMP protein Cmr4 [Thermogemmata fonticola]
MSEATTNSSTQTDPQAGALLFIHAQTGLHPGSGTALGTVDLPVQRERHTQWPIIPGSTLKGILRDACRRRGGNNADLFAAFGPETAEADKHAGALSLTDARILAFPVRSLKGVFAWVTCRAVLERLKRDLKLALPNGNALNLSAEWPSEDKKEWALCQQNSPLLIDGDKLVLEEFEFKRTGDADAFAAWLSQHAVADDATQKRLQSHLVVLHNDDFTHFARHATEIVARVGLDYERKTVKSGALFYEEFLPAETLFYSVVLASSSRRDGHNRSAQQILQYLRDNMPSVLQIGGDETIGKGLCAVRLDING